MRTMKFCIIQQMPDKNPHTMHSWFMWSYFVWFSITHPYLVVVVVVVLWGGADKSLARPGRKQTTATKLGIYSTYSPRSSIHFLSRCANFCKPVKKTQKVVRPTRSLRQQWPPRRTKNGDLSIVFSVQGTGGSPTRPDPENRVGRWSRHWNPR